MSASTAVRGRPTVRPDLAEWVALADAYSLPEIAKLRDVAYYTAYGWQQHHGYKAKNGHAARAERDRGNPKVRAVKSENGRAASALQSPQEPAKPSAEEWAELCRTHNSAQLQARFQRTYWTIWNWSRELGAIPLPTNDRHPGRPRNSAPIEMPVRPQYLLQPNHHLHLGA